MYELSDAIGPNLIQVLSAFKARFHLKNSGAGKNWLWRNGLELFITRKSRNFWVQTGGMLQRKFLWSFCYIDVIHFMLSELWPLKIPFNQNKNIVQNLVRKFLYQTLPFSINNISRYNHLFYFFQGRKVFWVCIIQMKVGNNRFFGWTFCPSKKQSSYLSSFWKAVRYTPTGSCR